MPSEEITHLVENSFVSEEHAVVAFGPRTPHEKASGTGAALWGEAMAALWQAAMAGGHPAPGRSCAHQPCWWCLREHLWGKGREPWGTLRKKVQEAALQTSREEGLQGTAPGAHGRGPWQSKGGGQGDGQPSYTITNWSQTPVPRAPVAFGVRGERLKELGMKEWRAQQPAKANWP